MDKLESDKIPLASLEPVVRFVAACIDDHHWYLTHIQNTTSNFPLKLRSFISDTQTEDYPSYYTDVKNLNSLFLQGMSVVPGAIELIGSLKQIPISQASKFIDPFLDALGAFDIDNLQPACEEEVADEEIESLRNLIRWGLISVKDLTSLMVFGERIFNLVKKAIKGDTEAFAKVIQIDPSAAKHIPELKLMIGEAYASEKSDLLDAVNYRKNNFIGRSKHKYHHIFILFYLLDMLQMLDHMSNRQVLDLYTNSGLNTYEEILEVKTVSDRRKFYLKSKI